MSDEHVVQVSERALVLAIPGDLRLLPGGAETGVAERLDAIAASFEVPEEPTTRLRAALETVARLAARPGTTRRSWALVRRPESGRVDAYVTLDLALMDAGSHQRFLRRADTDVAPAVDGVELVRRTVSNRSVSAGLVGVVHDLVLPRNDGGVGDPAVERAIVALFPEGFDKSLEFTIVTQDLGLFDDASEYLLELVSTVRPVDAAVQA
jgi:hypothetical protein